MLFRSILVSYIDVYESPMLLYTNVLYRCIRESYIAVYERPISLYMRVLYSCIRMSYIAVYESPIFNRFFPAHDGAVGARCSVLVDEQ